MSAPGWYPDPNGQPYQRWWDGAQWTDQTQAQQAQQTQAQQQAGWQQPPAQPGYPQPYAGPVPMTAEQARQWAMFAHLSGLLFGFLGPMIIYLIKKDEDPFVADQSREALNFHLSLLIYFTVGVIAAIVLTLILIGILLFPVLIVAGIAALVFEIIAAVQANNGVWYRYPLTIRFVK